MSTQLIRQGTVGQISIGGQVHKTPELGTLAIATADKKAKRRRLQPQALCCLPSWTVRQQSRIRAAQPASGKYGIIKPTPFPENSVSLGVRRTPAIHLSFGNGAARWCSVRGIAKHIFVAFEDLAQLGDAKQLLQALIQIDELQLAILPPGRDIEADDRT